MQLPILKLSKPPPGGFLLFRRYWELQAAQPYDALHRLACSYVLGCACYLGHLLSRNYLLLLYNYTLAAISEKLSNAAAPAGRPAQENYLLR